MGNMIKTDNLNTLKRFTIGIENMFNGAYAVFIFTNIFLLYTFFSNSQWNESGKIFNANFNIISYIFVIGVILLPLIIISIIYEVNSKNKKYISLYKKADYTLLYMNLFCCMLFFILGIYYFYQIYHNENDLVANYGTYFLRHKVPIGYYFIFLFCLSLFFFFAAHRIQNNDKDFRKIIIFFFTLANVLLLFAPNFLSDRLGGLFHSHAYINSIANISYSIPFDNYNISIYGHYALFYRPFFKILGKSYMTIQIAICFFGFITYASMFYVLSKTVKNTVIFILSCFAISGLQTILYATGQYYQANPHRLMFPSLALAFIVWCTYKKRNKVVIQTLKYCIGIFSLVWNFEMGLFTIVTLFAYDVFNDYIFRTSYKRICIDIAKNLFYVVFSIVGAIIILNIYNLLHGGYFLGIKRLIYPIGGSYGYDYSIDKLRLKLPNVYHVYVVQIMISLFALGCSLISRSLNISDEKKTLHIIKTSIAISGLCSLIYFMNRTAYSNISTSYAQLMLLLAIFGDEALLEFKQLFEKRNQILKRLTINLSIGIMCFLFSSSLAIESILAFNAAFCSRADSTWNTNSLKEFEDWTKEHVPENTFAYGHGIPELYIDLNWNTQLYVMDLSDLNPENGTYIFEQVKLQNLIFTNDKNVFKSDDWVEKASVKAGRWTYGIFARKGSVYDTEDYMDLKM